MDNTQKAGSDSGGAVVLCFIDSGLEWWEGLRSEAFFRAISPCWWRKWPMAGAIHWCEGLD